MGLSGARPPEQQGDHRSAQDRGHEHQGKQADRCPHGITDGLGARFLDQPGSVSIASMRLATCSRTSFTSGARLAADSRAADRRAVPDGGTAPSRAPGVAGADPPGAACCADAGQSSMSSLATAKPALMKARARNNALSFLTINRLRCGPRGSSDERDASRDACPGYCQKVKGGRAVGDMRESSLE